MKKNKTRVSTYVGLKSMNSVWELFDSWRWINITDTLEKEKKTVKDWMEQKVRRFHFLSYQDI